MAQNYTKQLENGNGSGEGPFRPEMAKLAAKISYLHHESKIEDKITFLILNKDLKVELIIFPIIGTDITKATKTTSPIGEVRHTEPGFQGSYTNNECGALYPTLSSLLTQKLWIFVILGVVALIFFFTEPFLKLGLCNLYRVEADRRRDKVTCLLHKDVSSRLKLK